MPEAEVGGQQIDARFIWCAAGAPVGILNLTTVPTIWSQTRADDLYDHTNFLSTSTTELANLNARGVSGELRDTCRTPARLGPRHSSRAG